MHVMNKNNNVTPIFVLGLDRNGTTWIQNMLCSHPAIAGAQHKAHWGIHESNICRHLLYWGDFNNNKQFIRFLELYSKGDYFRLAKADKEYFYRNRPDDFIHFFFEMMDSYAEKSGASYWTTKLDPFFYRRPGMLKTFIERAFNRYAVVKFIEIRRQYINTLTSAINMQGDLKHKWRKRPLAKEIFILVHMMAYTQGYHLIEKIISRRKGLFMPFELLKNSRTEAVTRMTGYLEIPFSPDMLNDGYPSNSSYKKREKNITIPCFEERIITRCLLPFFENHCFKLSRIVQNLKDHLL